MNTLSTLELNLRDSFFLDKDQLEEARIAGWQIPKIQIIPSIQFFDSLHALESLKELRNIKYDPSEDVVTNCATRVGIAIRRHEQQCKLYVIVKEWKESKNSNHNKEQQT